jgi:predicted lipid-binding transport protein (Tim44 family)
MTRNASQGVQNVVADVHLVKGDVSESWDEGDLQYATAFMRWSAVDYLARLAAAPGAPGYVVSGDPRRPVEQEEVWTFVRRRGGNWLLSAIQQV